MSPEESAKDRAEAQARELENKPKLKEKKK